MRQERIVIKPSGKPLKAILYNGKNLKLGDKLKKNPDGTFTILREEEDL